LRSLILAVAIIFGTVSLLPDAAMARTRHHYRSMSVKLASGRIIHFRMMRMGGQMMLVAPLSVFGKDAIGG